MELCEIKTAEQAVAAYEERFGGWPHYLMMDASDEVIVFEVRHALRTGREIEADNPRVVY